eukprot:gene2173-2469_t
MRQSRAPSTSFDDVRGATPARDDRSDHSFFNQPIQGNPSLKLPSKQCLKQVSCEGALLQKFRKPGQRSMSFPAWKNDFGPNWHLFPHLRLIEGNKSPFQLWLTLPRQSDRLLAEEMMENEELHGIDSAGPTPLSEHVSESNDVVEAPKITCPLGEDDFLRLRTSINPLRDSQSFGIDIYMEVVEFIARTTGERNSVLSYDAQETQNTKPFAEFVYILLLAPDNLMLNDADFTQVLGRLYTVDNHVLTQICNLVKLSEDGKTKRQFFKEVRAATEAITSGEDEGESENETENRAFLQAVKMLMDRERSVDTENGENVEDDGSFAALRSLMAEQKIFKEKISVLTSSINNQTKSEAASGTVPRPSAADDERSLLRRKLKISGTIGQPETGFRDESIRPKLRPYLKDPIIEDEDLIIQVNVIFSEEQEREVKLGRRPQKTVAGRVDQVTPTSPAQGDRKQNSANMNNAISRMMPLILAELEASFKSSHDQKQPGNLPQNIQKLCRDCETCQKEGWPTVLDLKTASGSKLPYSGYVELYFGLSENVRKLVKVPMLVAESVDHIITGYNMIKEVIGAQENIFDNFLSSLKSSFKSLGVNSVNTFVQVFQDSQYYSPVSVKTSKKNVSIKKN